MHMHPKYLDLSVCIHIYIYDCMQFPVQHNRAVAAQSPALHSKARGHILLKLMQSSQALGTR